jgi:UDP-glucuronate 4-epimerase
VNLKLARLQELQQRHPQAQNFQFMKLDISKAEDLAKLPKDITHIAHLAAQAGVRYSLTNPMAYVDSNLVGHTNMLELCRTLPKLQHFVYASSSSVYGNNTKLPFAVSDRVDHPISLYAATKKSCELMSHAYSHLFSIPTTGLRYFTVYGPWGRPDMAAFIFTKAIMNGDKVPVFNFGNMKRNFTFINDIVAGTKATLFNPPTAYNNYKIYNIGNNRAEQLLDFIKTLETIIGKPANLEMLPMQPGDVPETVADISDTMQDLGYAPTTNIEVGLREFVAWYQGYYKGAPG